LVCHPGVSVQVPLGLHACLIYVHTGRVSLRPSTQGGSVAVPVQIWSDVPAAACTVLTMSCRRGPSLCAGATSGGGSASFKLTARGFPWGAQSATQGEPESAPGRPRRIPPQSVHWQFQLVTSARCATARRLSLRFRLQAPGPGPAALRAWAGPAGPGRHRDTAARASSLPGAGPGLKVSDLGATGKLRLLVNSIEVTGT
jgi:hypothetical protein